MEKQKDRKGREAHPSQPLWPPRRTAETFVIARKASAAVVRASCAATPPRSSVCGKRALGLLCPLGSFLFLDRFPLSFFSSLFFFVLFYLCYLSPFLLFSSFFFPHSRSISAFLFFISCSFSTFLLFPFFFRFRLFPSLIPFIFFSNFFFLFLFPYSSFSPYVFFSVIIGIVVIFLRRSRSLPCSLGQQFGRCSPRRRRGERDFRGILSRGFSAQPLFQTCQEESGRGEVIGRIILSLFKY